LEVCDGAAEVSTGDRYEGVDDWKGKRDVLDLCDMLESRRGGGIVERFEAEF